MFEVDRPAIVLGSTQREDVLDVAACAAAGVEVVRRRSGGGVVLVEPGGLVWFDVVVPTAVLHEVGVGDDIGASMVWLGSHLAAVLGDDVTVHRGAMACTGWCPLVCFAGVGPGEVLADGAKLVGVSQRRTRAGRGSSARSTSSGRLTLCSVCSPGRCPTRRCHGWPRSLPTWLEGFRRLSPPASVS